MNRPNADRLVGTLTAIVLVVGGVLTWQAYQENRAMDQTMGGMMDGSMTGVHGTNPLWYVLGTLFVAVLLGGFYLTLRNDLVEPPTDDERGDAVQPTDAGTIAGDETSSQPAETLDPKSRSRQRVLDLIPEDERRILEPVIESPGITQVALRDRSAFSKSKVSQTVSDLENRGLLYRERQGRTYRVYPSDDLRQTQG